MKHEEKKTTLYVDVREFSSIYKRITKGWRIEIIEISGNNKKVVKNIRAKRIPTKENTGITKPGRYQARLIGPRPFGLLGILLRKKSEVVESQEVNLELGKETTIVFERRDVRREKYSIRADAPWRVEPSQKTFPVLLEIVDLPEESKKIEIERIYFIDYVSNNTVEENLITHVETEDGLDLKDQNGNPTILNEEENTYGIFIRCSTIWYRIVYLKKDFFQKTKYNSIYLGVKFIFKNREPFETCLRIRIANEPLPKFNENWYYGDIHYHSEFTTNLTEFGGPMRMAKSAGISLGLNWVFITDHSCDFSGNAEFLMMQELANKLSENKKFLVIGSEEITVKKKKSDFLHMLSNNTIFIRGAFEGTYYLNDVFIKFLNKESQSFAFAAHPTVFPNPNWEEDDKDYQTALEHEKFLGLQIFNAKTKNIYSLHEPDYLIDMYRKVKKKMPFNLKKILFRTFSNYIRQWKKGVEIWDKYLLEGLKKEPIRKLFIVGGSDAHGDFNFGIVINPLTGNLITDNAFGKVRTLVYCEELAKENLIDSLKNGRCIVTDGPIINFKITGINSDKECSAELGETLFISDTKIQITIEWKCIKEFGIVKNIKLFRNGEIIRNMKINWSRCIFGKDTIELNQLEEKAYYRLEIISQKWTEKFFGYTNPIWVIRK